MRERHFIDRNKEKWQELEKLLLEEQADPADLGELFVKVTDDLSYARTFYPFRSVRAYLNSLARKIFDSLYKRRKARRSDFMRFWVCDLPLMVYEARAAMRLSFLFFTLSFLIGVFSSIYDPEFARFILGESYVEMTEENIASGDPLAVYQERDALGMTMGIAMNNLWVDLLTFFSGIFAGIGSLAILLYNGIMVGAFQYFFIERGLFWESFLTIWLHGTLEMSAAVIAGAAGLTMGSGLLFPGTLSRVKAFRRSARRGVQILMGIVPLTLIAAFVEGFFTRYTQAPELLRGVFIFLCLAFVLYYYVYLPVKLGRKTKAQNKLRERLTPDRDEVIRYDQPRSGGELFVDVFSFFRKYASVLFSSVFRISLAILLLFIVIRLVTLLWHEGLSGLSANAIFGEHLVAFSDWYIYSEADLLVSGIFYALAAATLVWVIMGLFFKELSRATPLLSARLYSKTFRFFALVILMAAMMLFVNLLEDAVVVFAFVPMSFMGLVAFMVMLKGKNLFYSSWLSLEVVLKGFGQYVVLSLLLGVIGLFLFLLLDSSLVALLMDFILMNFFIEDADLGELFTEWIFSFVYLFSFLVYFALVFIGMGQLYFSVREVYQAEHLYKRIDAIGSRQKIRGLEKEENRKSFSGVKAGVWMLLFFLQFFFIPLNAPLQAQSSGSNDVLTLDKQQWEAMSGAVNYPPLEEIEEPEELLVVEDDYDQKLRQTRVWAQIFKVIAGLAVVALLVWGFASLAAGEPLFMPKSGKLRTEQVAGSETIERLRSNLAKADIKTPLEAAEEAGDFSLAVRLAYLQALQLLVQKRLVKWKQDKTNGEFLYELLGTSFYRPFSDLTRIFDYTEYGEYPIDADTYPKLKSRFIDFYTMLKKIKADKL